MTTTIHAPRSIYYDGDWHDAHWTPEIIDEATGELTLLATSADLGDNHRPRVVIVRLTSDLVRSLRTAAGFTDPPARLAEAEALLTRINERLLALEDANSDSLMKSFDMAARRNRVTGLS